MLPEPRHAPDVSSLPDVQGKNTRRLLVFWRLMRLSLHLARGLLTCALVFPFLGREGRQRRIRRWSARLVALCGIQLDTRLAAPPAGKALVVCNHVSWLDIFVINSVIPCRFVAKADIRGWPLVGWLCEQTGTIFIARGRLREVRRTFEDLVGALHAGEHVAFFPEGTTALQGQLLPFHANLFEAAIDAEVPVQPFALAYLDGQGRYHPAADFVGDCSFTDSVLAIAGARGMTARLISLPLLEPGNDAHRRELAADACARVEAGLRQIAPGF